MLESSIGNITEKTRVNTARKTSFIEKNPGIK